MLSKEFDLALETKMASYSKGKTMMAVNVSTPIRRKKIDKLLAKKKE